jgi:hypothetical protein
VLDNGRVFFNAFDGLVPADSNVAWDAYQFEPLGVGDCVAGPGGSAVVRVGDGCVALISSGTAEGESAFIDASITGDDVFIMTRGKLSVLDKDDGVDVYDAKVGGLAADIEINPGCSGEACHAAPPAPGVQAPGSVTFQGPGNVRAGKKCPKGKHKAKRKGKTRCVPKRKHGSHQRQAGRGKGGSR